MIKLTRLTYLSQQWKPHHELLLHWIAESAITPQVLLNARTHIQNLDLQTVVVEVDDGVELLSLLPKIKYPIKGSVALWAYNFVENEQDELTIQMIENMLKEVYTNTAILYCIERLLTKHSRFYNLLTEVIYALPSNDLLENTAQLSTLWESQRSYNMYQSYEILKIFAAALASRLDSIDAAPKLLVEIVSLNIPLSCTPLRELEEKISDISKNCLSASNIVIVVSRIQGAHSHNRQANKLIESLHEGIEKYACQLEFRKECLMFTISLLSMNRKPSDKLLMAAIDYLGECEPLLFRLLCYVIADYYHHHHSEEDNYESNTVNINKFNLSHAISYKSKDNVDAIDENDSNNIIWKLKSMIVKKIEVSLHTLVVNANSDKRHLFLFQLWCLSYLQPNECRQLLEEWVKEISVSELSTCEVFTIVKILSTLQYYPKETICELRKRANVTEMTREECLYLACCLANIDVPLSKEIVNKFIGETTHRHFEHRRKTTVSNLNQLKQIEQWISRFITEEEAFVMLNTLSSMKNYDDSLLSVYRQMLEKIKYNKYYVMHLIQKALKERRISEPLTQLLLETALQFVHENNINEVILLLHFLVNNSNRDVNVLRSLLDRIRELPFSLKCLLEAMQTARKLNLYSEIQKYGFVYNITACESIAEKDLLQILMLCEHEERFWIMKNINCAESILTSFDINTATLEELLTLLLLVKEDCVKRKQIFNTIATHKEPLAQYLNTKDIVDILETLHPDEPADIVFRTASKIIQASNANELMRLYRVICNVSTTHSIMFRVLGRALITNAALLTPENAIQWLSLYAQKNIRDDSVVKSLLRRVMLKTVKLTNAQKEQLEQIITFYGYDEISKKEKNTWSTRKRKTFFAVK